MDEPRSADLPERPAIVPVTGPPGAGKTTALMRIVEEDPTVARFGVRDYGLRLAAAGDPLGLAMQATLLREELLPDDLVRSELLHFLDRLAPGVRSVAVEGYPRDSKQCADLLDALRRRGSRVAAFVVVEVPDELVHRRVADRQICCGCGLPVDAAATPRCPDCGGALKQRDDDAAVRLRRRLAQYRDVSRGPRAYFERLGLLRVVDGLRPPAQVRAALAALLDGDRHQPATDGAAERVTR